MISKYIALEEFTSDVALSRRAAAPVFAIALILLWIVAVNSASPSQYADSIEQYNWAHSLEWGYWKHPPLPTWLMRGAIALFGATHWTAAILAAACLAATILFTWRIAGMLLPPGAAALAVMLWPMHHAFSWRAVVYNHNTVLVLASSAMVWAALNAARTQRLRDWLALGVATAAAFLTKYQAVVPLVAITYGLWSTGVLRSAQQRNGFALAMLTASILCLPHAWWAVAEGLPTLRYVEEVAPPVGLMARPAMLLKFMVNQVVLLASMLMVGAAFLVAPRWRGDAPAAEDNSRALDTRRWLVALVGVPLLVVAVVLLATGARPQKFWGMQTLQFFSLWLAWRLAAARRDVPLMVAALAALAINGAGIALSVHDSHDPQAVSRMRALDRVVPAHELAARATQAWARTTSCPLRYVAGPGFIAGMVSVYSGEWPAVLEANDFRKSPWITEEDIERHGAIFLTSPRPIGDSVLDSQSMVIPVKPDEGGKAVVRWEVLPPLHECR